MKKFYPGGKPTGPSVDYGRDLNAEQYAAVMHGEGPALVLAGAGTGKTRVVTYRVARLIESGTMPENILLLTFTNKAAQEMMRRVEQLIGRKTAGLIGGTFHHTANTLLRQHHHLAGYRQGFSILDREDSKDLFDACIAETFKKEKGLPRGAVFLEINSLARNTSLAAAEVIAVRYPHFAKFTGEFEQVSDLYEKKKLALNLMDFDDLLVRWKILFEEHETIREFYSLKFRYVLVDEYQDTNRLQADIVDLTTRGNGNLMVVGDDAQSIYSFRGADFENILGFPERYPGSSIFTLTRNYRSTPEILHLANKIISANRRRFGKELRSVTAPGTPPRLVPVKDVLGEAEFVASLVTEMQAGGRPLRDMAVLYRSHYQSMETQMEFQRRGISFEVRSGLKFFELAHVKDVLSLLKVILNPLDEMSWKRILKFTRGIGNITAARVWEFLRQSESPLDAAQEAGRLVPEKAKEGFTLFLALLKALRDEKYSSSPSAALDHILKHGYEEYLYDTYPDAEMRLEDIEHMEGFAVRYDSLETFLSDLALQSAETGADDGTGDGDRIVLSTVHQAKGLEWTVVFIIGMSEGRFPSAKSLKGGDEEEERRLFYVATTRAREVLSLCCPLEGRDWQGGFLRPSRFITELPDDCFEEIGAQDV